MERDCSKITSQDEYFYFSVWKCFKIKEFEVQDVIHVSEELLKISFRSTFIVQLQIVILTDQVILELKILKRFWSTKGISWNTSQFVSIELQILKWKNKKNIKSWLKFSLFSKASNLHFHFEYINFNYVLSIQVWLNVYAIDQKVMDQRIKYFK